MSEPINPPGEPQRGPCEPSIEEEPIQIPQETPIPVKLPVPERVPVPVSPERGSFFFTWKTLTAGD
jgi:hypothetical protein